MQSWRPIKHYLSFVNHTFTHLGLLPLFITNCQSYMNLPLSLNLKQTSRTIIRDKQLLTRIFIQLPIIVNLNIYVLFNNCGWTITNPNIHPLHLLIYIFFYRSMITAISSAVLYLLKKQPFAINNYQPVHLSIAHRCFSFSNRRRWEVTIRLFQMPSSGLVSSWLGLYEVKHE